MAALSCGVLALSDLPKEMERPLLAPGQGLSQIGRWLLLAFAGLCVVLAIVGVFLPGMPTTVFVLMAAWAAARSSPRFLFWLESHRLFGPMICDWREGGYVSRRAKWSAAGLMLLCAALLWLTPTPPAVAVTASLIMAAVICWLWRRPEREAGHVGKIR